MLRFKTQSYLSFLAIVRVVHKVESAIWREVHQLSNLISVFFLRGWNNYISYGLKEHFIYVGEEEVSLINLLLFAKSNFPPSTSQCIYCMFTYNYNIHYYYYACLNIIYSLKTQVLSCSYPLIFANFVSLRVGKLMEHNGKMKKKKRGNQQHTQVI